MRFQNAGLPQCELVIDIQLKLVCSLHTAHELTSRFLPLPSIFKGLEPFFE
jgi:hypothetical protein